MYIVANKAGGVKPSKRFVIGHETKGFGVCPARSWSCFVQVFPHSIHIHIRPLWNGYVYSGSLRCASYHSNRIVINTVDTANNGDLKSLWQNK